MRLLPLSRWLHLAALSLVLAASPASAHGDGDMGKPQHGGQFVLDEWHRGAELVVAGKTIVFHMTEHMEPADQTGASYSAVIEHGGANEEVPVKIEGSTVTGTLAAPLPANAVVVLKGVDSSGTKFSARFEPEAK